MSECFRWSCSLFRFKTSSYSNRSATDITGWILFWKIARRTWWDAPRFEFSPEYKIFVSITVRMLPPPYGAKWYHLYLQAAIIKGNRAIMVIWSSVFASRVQWFVSWRSPTDVGALCTEYLLLCMEYLPALMYGVLALMWGVFRIMLNISFYLFNTIVCKFIFPAYVWSVADFYVWSPLVLMWVATFFMYGVPGRLCTDLRF